MKGLSQDESGLLTMTIELDKRNQNEKAKER